jgi:hypothetical protein
MRGAPHHSVYNPVIESDTARPISLKIMFKGLRFPEPLKRIALDVFDELVNRCENLLIGSLPMQVILPCMRRPKQIHAGAALRPWLDELMLC